MRVPTGPSKNDTNKREREEEEEEEERRKKRKSEENEEASHSRAVLQLLPRPRLILSP